MYVVVVALTMLVLPVCSILLQAATDPSASWLAIVGR